MNFNNKKSKLAIFRHDNILLHQVDLIPSKVNKISTKLSAKNEKTWRHHKLICKFNLYELVEPENTIKCTQILEISQPKIKIVVSKE